MVFFDALRPAVLRNLERQDDAPCEREGDGWSGRVGGQCPVQGEGTVDGVPWYFRARGTRWSLAIAATPDGDPIDVDYLDVPVGAWLTRGAADEEGEFSASWMGYAEAWRHVEAAIAAYRAWCAEQASVPVAERKVRGLRAKLDNVATRRADMELAMQDAAEAPDGVVKEMNKRFYDMVCGEHAQAQADLDRAVSDAHGTGA
jgi:hypothetical protein